LGFLGAQKLELAEDAEYCSSGLRCSPAALHAQKRKRRKRKRTRMIEVSRVQTTLAHAA